MKYKELVQMWRDSKLNWMKFKDEMAWVAGRIFVLLKASFDVADDHKFKLVPVAEENGDKLKKTLWAPIGAIELLENGWVNFAILIMLEASENTYPKSNYKIEIFIRKIEEGYSFKIAKSGKEIPLSKEDLTKGDVSKVENEIDKLMTNYLAKGLENWMKDE